MARGDHAPTQQAGEYLVAAELARAGAICATFAANVRHFDVMASGPAGYVPVQVKTKRSGSWQLDIRDFAEVTIAGGMQVIGALKREPIPGLIYVFVDLKSYGADEFFVIGWAALRDRVVRDHRAWLATHGGRRPRNPDSTHTALKSEQLGEWRGRWDLITDVLGHAAQLAFAADGTAPSRRLQSRSTRRAGAGRR